MGKNPAFQFYPADWTRDLDDQDLEVEGAWIRIICRLWWSETRGEATKPLKEWARILRKTEQKTIKIFQILIEKHIADGSILDNQNITIMSRRMKRMVEISKIRYEVGLKGGNPALRKNENNLVNQTSNQNPRSSSSFSNTKNNICADSSDFDIFYSSYPKRIGRKKASLEWEKLRKQGSLPAIEAIMSAIENQKRAKQKLRDAGQFVAEWPDPERWIKNARWEDEICVALNEQPIPKRLPTREEELEELNRTWKP